MIDANEKLRRLRSKMLDCVGMWEGYAFSSPSDASHWKGRKWVAEYVVQRIDALLEEPEPKNPCPQSDAELQRLYDEFRRINDDNGWASAQTRLLEAVCRRLGCE